MIAVFALSYREMFYKTFRGYKSLNLWLVHNISQIKSIHVSYIFLEYQHTLMFKFHYVSTNILVAVS